MNRSSLMWIGLIVALFLFVAAVGGRVLLRSIQSNQGNLELSRALVSTDLSLPDRLALLHQAQQHLDQTDSHLIARTEAEWLERAQALVSSIAPTRTFEVRRQLVMGSDFTDTLSQWVQYQSDWILEQDPDQPDNVVAVAVQLPAGLGGLNQIVKVQSGACYLYTADLRFQAGPQDRSQVLYWESYSAGKPIGHWLETVAGNLSWQSYASVVCVPPSSDTLTQLITLYPVRAGLKSRVWVDNVRLYELRDRIEQ